LKQGTLPILRLGAFEVPEVPAFYGAPIGQLEKGLDIDLDGLVGSGLLAAFRVTLVDEGRTMWLEDMPVEALRGPGRRPGDLDLFDMPPAEPEGDESDEQPAPSKKPGSPPQKPRSGGSKPGGNTAEPAAAPAQPPRASGGG
jgi:hypothetical protein